MNNQFMENQQRFGGTKKKERTSWISSLSWLLPVYISLVLGYAAYVFVKSKLSLLINGYFVYVAHSPKLKQYSVKNRSPPKNADKKKTSKAVHEVKRPSTDEAEEKLDKPIVDRGIESRLAKVEAALAKLVTLYGTLSDRIDELKVEQSTSILDGFLDDENMSNRPDVRRRIRVDEEKPN